MLIPGVYINKRYILVPGRLYLLCNQSYGISTTVQAMPHVSTPGMLASSPVPIVPTPGTYCCDILQNIVPARYIGDRDTGIASSPARAPFNPSTCLLRLRRLRTRRYSSPSSVKFCYAESCAPDHPVPWFPNYLVLVV